jgi:hypothetical protein
LIAKLSPDAGCNGNILYKPRRVYSGGDPV